MLDALIIGGGPAGATSALLLAEKGWSVGLIEKTIFPRRKVCGEFISATSLPLLYKLGIAEFYLEQSGPEIQRVGIYANNLILTSNMPKVNSSKAPWGRALGREHLDTKLIERAKEQGAQIWQPAEAKSVLTHDNFCTTVIKVDDQEKEITSRIVIIANGSWEKKINQPEIKSHKPHDLLAFKAHFKNTDLSSDLMPLLAFPGGYGGLVHTDHQRVTLSCCIRRDVLQNLRKKNPGLQAGEVVFQYIKSSCRGVKETLSKAKREGAWLATGPIQPGIRQKYTKRLFFVGNIAGEAHPIIAEGISMAMQSAWLLTNTLHEQKIKVLTKNNLDEMGASYTQLWNKHFANRLRASAFFARCAMMQPWVSSLLSPILKQCPAILTIGAKLSGKNQIIIPLDEHY